MAPRHLNTGRLPAPDLDAERLREEKSMKDIERAQTIIRLEAENVKRLSAVEITPEGEVVIIGGDNGQGKTSVLDSITYALAGGRSICDQPIRAGESKAHVVVETEDLVVRRTFTQSGGTLRVSEKDGSELKAPQSVLDALCGRLAFDPLSFMRADREEQGKTLSGLLGLDLSAFDRRRRELYEKRTQENRDVKRAESDLARFDRFEEVTESAEVSHAETLAEIERIEAENREIDEAGRRRREALSAIASEREGIERRIEEIDREIEAITARSDELDRQEAAFPAEPTAALQDTAELRERLTGIEALNEKIRANRAHAEAAGRVEVSKAKAQELTAAIKEIDAEKLKAIAAAEMPIEGLSFGEEGGVTFGGIPLDQCSSAEQLRISVAMGFAMNPKLRVLLIRDGSLLDAKSLQDVARMAAENSAQVWIERVGDADTDAVIIEDGAVRVAK